MGRYRFSQIQKKSVFNYSVTIQCRNMSRIETAGKRLRIKSLPGSLSLTKTSYDLENWDDLGNWDREHAS